MSSRAIRWHIWASWGNSCFDQSQTLKTKFDSYDIHIHSMVSNFIKIHCPIQISSCPCHCANNMVKDKSWNNKHTDPRADWFTPTSHPYLIALTKGVLLHQLQLTEQTVMYMAFQLKYIFVSERTNLPYTVWHSNTISAAITINQCLLCTSQVVHKYIMGQHAFPHWNRMCIYDLEKWATSDNA